MKEMLNDKKIKDIGEDIKQARKLAEQVKTSGGFHKEVIQNAPIGIYAINREGEIDLFNPKMMELSGAKKPEQVIGANVFTMPSYKKAGLTKYFKQGFAGKPFTVEAVEYFSNVANKRSVRRYQGVPIKNNEGQVVRLLLFVEDITENDRLIHELKESEEKYRTIFEWAGDGIFTLDTKGRFLSVNKKAEELTGYKAEEVLGKNFVTAGLVAITSLPKILKGFAQRLIGRETKPYEFELIRKDGTRSWMELSSTPLKKGRRVVSVLGIIRDATARRKLNEAKTEFVSMASHQLRSPLTLINWYMEMLLSGGAGKLNDKQKQFLDEIYKGNQRMVNLVNALLNVSRIDLGTFVIEPEPTNITKIAISVLKELKPSIEKKQMKVEEKYDKDIPIVNVDPKLARIIFQNLLSNAVKYTPSKGKISLSITKKKKDLLIEVADNGYGIPKSQQSRIFSKFFRADNIRKKDVEGTGLGLYIIKSIVEKPGGKIWFESEENKGTTFYVTLPLKVMKKK